SPCVDVFLRLNCNPRQRIVPWPIELERHCDVFSYPPQGPVDIPLARPSVFGFESVFHRLHVGDHVIETDLHTLKAAIEKVITDARVIYMPECDFLDIVGREFACESEAFGLLLPFWVNLADLLHRRAPWNPFESRRLVKACGEQPYERQRCNDV